MNQVSLPSFSGPHPSSRCSCRYGKSRLHADTLFWRTDQGTGAAAMQRRSGSQRGECREKSGVARDEIALVHKTNGTASLGSGSESSREFLRPRSVFPDAAVISASSTTRTLGGAKRSPYRRERCADCAANPASIARARHIRTGRSAGGANEEARSFGETVSW
jgi:hypothetical protein